MSMISKPFWQLEGNYDPEPLEDKKAIKKANRSRRKASPKFTGVPSGTLFTFVPEYKLVVTKETSIVYLTRKEQACIILGYKISEGYKVLSIIGPKGKLTQGSKVISDTISLSLDNMVRKMASLAHQRIHKKKNYSLESITSPEVLLESQLAYLISLEPCQVPNAKLDEVKVIPADIKEICDLLEL